MHTVKITAHVGKGENRKVAGSRDFPVPDSMDEAIKLFGGKKALVEAAMKHRAIEVQAQIRAEAKGPAGETNTKGMLDSFED